MKSSRILLVGAVGLPRRHVRHWWRRPSRKGPEDVSTAAGTRSRVGRLRRHRQSVTISPGCRIRTSAVAAEVAQRLLERRRVERGAGAERRPAPTCCSASGMAMRGWTYQARSAASWALMLPPTPLIGTNMTSIRSSFIGRSRESYSVSATSQKRTPPRSSRKPTASPAMATATSWRAKVAVTATSPKLWLSPRSSVTVRSAGQPQVCARMTHEPGPPKTMSGLPRVAADGRHVEVVLVPMGGSRRSGGSARDRRPAG